MNFKETLKRKPSALILIAIYSLFLGFTVPGIFFGLVVYPGEIISLLVTFIIVWKGLWDMDKTWMYVLLAYPLGTSAFLFIIALPTNPLIAFLNIIFLFRSISWILRHREDFS